MIAAHVFQWQIEQDEHLDVAVTIVPVAGATVPDSTRNDIATFVQQALGAVKVAVIPAATVRRESNGKFRPVKSRATTRSVNPFGIEASVLHADDLRTRRRGDRW
jgi:hypothetical protein